MQYFTIFPWTRARRATCTTRLKSSIAPPQPSQSRLSCLPILRRVSNSTCEITPTQLYVAVEAAPRDTRRLRDVSSNMQAARNFLASGRSISAKQGELLAGLSRSSSLSRKRDRRGSRKSLARDLSSLVRARPPASSLARSLVSKE